MEQGSNLLFYIVPVAVIVLAILISNSRANSDTTLVSEEQIHEAVIAGRKIDAIKYYKKLYSVTIGEAKAGVERIEQDLKREGRIS